MCLIMLCLISQQVKIKGKLKTMLNKMTKWNRLSPLVAPMLLAALLGAALSARGQLTPVLDDPLPPLIPFGKVKVDLQSVATGFASPVVAATVPGQPDWLFVGDQIGLVWAVD